MAQALAGIRVLDLTRLLPGAVATLMLADLGAAVIKVEDPIAGDYSRWMPPLVDGLGATFRASNRNKQSIIVNLKHEDGQAVLHRLVQEADVLVEGFRPGVTQRLRVDYDTLRAINPRLVYCSLSGWGQDGPYTEISGHDLNYVALTGLLGGMHTPQPLGGQVADVGGSYVGVMGILAALFQRERTGTGDYVDVALSESALPFAFFQIIESSLEELPGGRGTLTGAKAYYQVYTSLDNKPMALAAIEAKFWANFCHAVGHPEWIDVQNDDMEQERLKHDLTTLFAQKTAAEWQQQLAPVDCCFALLTPPGDVPDDPHIRARGMMGVGADGVPWMRSPLRLRSNHFQRESVPDYGEHTRTVLQQAGYGDADIAALFDTGAIGRKLVK